jgi:hypothetical protein
MAHRAAVRPSAAALAIAADHAVAPPTGDTVDDRPATARPVVVRINSLAADRPPIHQINDVALPVRASASQPAPRQASRAPARPIPAAPRRATKIDPDGTIDPYL